MSSQTFLINDEDLMTEKLTAITAKQTLWGNVPDRNLAFDPKNFVTENGSPAVSFLAIAGCTRHYLQTRQGGFDNWSLEAERAPPLEAQYDAGSTTFMATIKSGLADHHDISTAATLPNLKFVLAWRDFRDEDGEVPSEFPFIKDARATADLKTAPDGGVDLLRQGVLLAVAFTAKLWDYDALIKSRPMAGPSKGKAVANKPTLCLGCCLMHPIPLPNVPSSPRPSSRSMKAEEASFTVVKSARRNRSKRQQRTDLVSLSKLIDRETSAANDVFFQNCLECLATAGSPFGQSFAFVCYGLGSLRNSKTSRVQLLFLQRIVDRFQIVEPITFVDPIFTDEELAYLLDQGYRLPKEHGLVVNCWTFLYMPRCPRSLFEAILRANWNSEGLSRLCILGNSLELYILNEMRASEKSKFPCLAKIVPLLEHVVLPVDGNAPEGFNDMWLQWASISRLPSGEDTFWILPNLATLEQSNDDDG